MRELEHFVGGKSVAGTSGRHGPVFDPARGVQTGTVPLADAAEIDDAVAIANDAAVEWGAGSLSSRANVLFRLRDLVSRAAPDLAAAVTAEHGKVLSDAAGEVARGLENIEFACGIPHLLKGAHSTEVSSGVDVHTVLEPLGVVAGITPFNFPVMVPLWMLANAVACGNAFVLKPSERDPSPSLLIAELAHEAGVPDGVLNVVHGDAEAVDALLAHPDVAAVSFVGSTPIARHVYEEGAKHGKRVQALGGAKNHMIVLPDADVGAAADAAISAGYGSAGERCMAISVAVPVGEKTADILLKKLVPRVESLKIGLSTDAQADYGPVITRAHLETVKSYVELGLQEGAKLLVDGRDFKLQGYERGHFMGGCLFDHVTPDMRIYKEEIFGPVLSVVRANTFEDATKLVNDHEYGNGTAIFTRDGDAAREFCNRVQIGMVGVNVPIPVPMAFHSFGGWKRSLFGDMAVYGTEGVRFYTKLKTVTSRWPTGIRAGAEYVMPTMR